MRRRLHGIGWQLLILIAAVVDIIVLLVEICGTGGVAVDTLTGLVLLVFTVDLALRMWTYHCLFFKRAWNWADLLVLLASFVLYLVGLTVDTGDDAAANVTGSDSSNAYSGASTAIHIDPSTRRIMGHIQVYSAAYFGCSSHAFNRASSIVFLLVHDT